MRMKRALLFALSIALVGTSCNSGGRDGDGEERGTLPVTKLPSMCEGFDNFSEDAQITFVRGTLLFGVSPEGRSLHCIAGVAGPNPIAWGPQGDFVVDVGFSASVVISAAGRVTISGPGKLPRFQAISRPSGANGLFIERTGTRLAKVPTDGGKLEDISFLRRHDEAAYHPAGTQLAVLGETEDDIYGMWLVTNYGKKPHLIVPSRDEDEFYGMSFSALGGNLYYVEDQHTFFELRVLDLSTLEEGVALPKSKLVVKEKQPIIALASPFDDEFLGYRVGSCDKGFTTFIQKGSSPVEVGGDLGQTQPVGWLPDGRLLLASTEDLCDTQRTLDLYVVDGESTELVVEDVAQAAVRAVLPFGPVPVSGTFGATPE